MKFRDRSDAGRRLAATLGEHTLRDPIVLALPRGGVPVAFEVAQALGAPLEVFMVRKVGAPHQPEFGIGAIAEGDGEVRNEHAIVSLGLSEQRWNRLVATEREELDRRVRRYRGGRALPDLKDHDVIVVDDGLATGVTAEAALRSLSGRGARRLILAVPVCAADTARRLASLADAIVCVHTPQTFAAVGWWYEDFGQTGDDEVVALLQRASSATK